MIHTSGSAKLKGRFPTMARLSFPGHSGDYLDYTLTPRRGDIGADTVVVYVHGFASRQDGEKALYFRDRFVEAGCDYLAFDHRGHGNASGTMKELTVTRNLEDLDAVVSGLCGKHKNRVLIGSSMGGQTAAWYAAMHPGRIAANLLIAPGFRFIENRKRELGAEGVRQLRQRGEMDVRNEWVAVTIGRALLEDGERYPVEKLLTDYQTPTLILHGTQDGSVPYADSVAFAEKSSARPLELVLIAGGDHRLTDLKEELFRSMKGFLDGLGLIG
jgi:pimeloyl-ACP methyl ester carboxylesterase